MRWCPAQCGEANKFWTSLHNVIKSVFFIARLPILTPCLGLIFFACISCPTPLDLVVAMCGRACVLCTPIQDRKRIGYGPIESKSSSLNQAWMECAWQFFFRFNAPIQCTRFLDIRLYGDTFFCHFFLPFCHRNEPLFSALVFCMDNSVSLLSFNTSKEKINFVKKTPLRTS